MWSAGFWNISILLSRKCADSCNSAATPICWAGCVGCANKIHHYTMPPAQSTSSASAVCWMIWLPRGHSIQPDLIRREDFPPQPHYLPRPLNADDDQRLQQELRRTDDLLANALLLTRLTGIRIG